MLYRFDLMRMLRRAVRGGGDGSDSKSNRGGALKINRFSNICYVLCVCARHFG